VYATYQTVAAGGWIETTKFLDMVKSPDGRTKLAQLGIPCVQVGSVDLKAITVAGSGGNTIDMTGPYGMNGVKFFAPPDGGRPQIWATDSVNGGYTGNPKGVKVSLSSTTGNLSADFTMQQFSSGKWLSTVIPPNPVSPNAPNGVGSYSQPFTFKGAGAGTYTGTTFTGTAAGVAK
jgi:hypothetical protein